jgi:hypothetical protein
VSNTYTTQFTCQHPDTLQPVPYTLRVKTSPQLVVEAADLVAAGIRMASKKRKPEDVADALRTMFPGKHTLTGQHLGTKFKLQREGRA